MNYKSYKNLLPVFILLLFLPSCDDITLQNQEVGIRVGNASSLTMENILVAFPDMEVNYGNLEPGKKTEYKTLSKAYRYAFIEMQVQGKRVVLQPIDFVGEEFLDAGSYTYKLNINEDILESDGQDAIYSLSLELEKD